MAEQRNTVEKILDELNKGDATRPWILVDGLFQLSGAKIETEKVVDDPRAIALKIFLNKKTTEVRMYVAKWLNDPEAKNLS